MKLFSLFLGLAGLVTIPLQHPIPQQLPAPKTKTVLASGANTAIGNNKDTKNRTGNFTLIKSPSSNKTSIQENPAAQKKARSGSPTIGKTQKTPGDRTSPPNQTVPINISTASPSTSSETTIETQNSTTTPTAPTENPPDFEKINSNARLALVNIICTSQTGGLFNPVSGSGVIIKSNGLILTNAHLAQYYLLKDYRVKNFLDCIVRQGSPAHAVYRAQLVYISPAWINSNYKSIIEENPVGTGENDFGLLLIASSTNPDLIVPTSFPAIEPDIDENHINKGDNVVVVGYPAGFLGGIGIQRDLYLVSSIATINKLFTFRDGSLDDVTLGGSPVAQKGSSGGAVVSKDKKLIAIVTTLVGAEKTSDRDLEAITLAHISRSFKAQTGINFSDFLSSDPTFFIDKFNQETYPALKKLLEDTVRK